jgi:hypothetical protein
MRSFLCHQNSRQKQRGYKDGLQPESLADGNWLVKQINQCRKLKLNLTQTWGVCMSLDSGMHWSQNWQKQRAIMAAMVQLLKCLWCDHACPKCMTRLPARPLRPRCPPARPPGMINKKRMHLRCASPTWIRRHYRHDYGSCSWLRDLCRGPTPSWKKIVALRLGSLGTSQRP